MALLARREETFIWDGGKSMMGVEGVHLPQEAHEQ